MSDFILEYDVLEDIAKYSNSLGRRAEEYGESLERKIIGAIDGVTGPSSGYLLNASDHVRDKINALNIKSKEFYQFSEQIKKLLEVAEQMDQEVADAIMAQREYFLDHHESLRIEDWKAKLQGLLVELKNSIPLLEVIADVLDGLDTIFESLKDSIKHWYECEGGKYIVDVVKSIGGVALAVGFLAVAIGALALPTAGIFAICGVIGAGIAVVNSVTNVATSFRAADAALDGDPAWARIYGKQDKLSDVLRQTNFGSKTWNQLSNFSAGAIDATEVICDVVGVAEMGKNVVKLFKGDAFKLLKNKGGISYSDLKNGVKSGIVDLKSTIKQSYKDLKYGIKGNFNKKSLLGDVPADNLNGYNKYLDEITDGSKGGNKTLLNGEEWNNYFKEVYGSENVNWKYGTKIDDKVITLAQEDLGSLSYTFTDGVYRTVENTEDITVYRVFGGNADAGGGFATTDPAISRAQTQMDSAILSEWNSFDYEAEIIIPKGTKLNIGTVESQYTFDGELLTGGADQILLPKNWDLNWIKNIRCME